MSAPTEPNPSWSWVPDCGYLCLGCGASGGADDLWPDDSACLCDEPISGPYNGHKDWQHWNVSLWLANDEPLYRLCVEELRAAHGRRHSAAKRVLAALGGPGTETADGAEYTVPTIREALKGFREDAA